MWSCNSTFRINNISHFNRSCILYSLVRCISLVSIVSLCVIVYLVFRLLWRLRSRKPIFVAVTSLLDFHSFNNLSFYCLEKCIAFYCVQNIQWMQQISVRKHENIILSFQIGYFSTVPEFEVIRNITQESTN